DYEVCEILGKGGFGCVYKAKCLKSNNYVAIKMINKQAMHCSGMANRVRQEVAIHSKLKHPSILELYTFFEDFDNVYLVLELAENGELQQYLRKRITPFSEYEAAAIFRKVVDGLLYLHEHNIIHRDMSLSNLLITKDMNIKIADFGLATELNQPDEKHHTLCGTPNYISPEVASRASHGLPADVWGLGCMLYTLLVGTPPFDTNGVKSTLARVVTSLYHIPAHLSPDVRDLIERLLQKNPNERIKLDDVLKHPFLSRYGLGSKNDAMSTINQKFTSGADSGMGTISSMGRSDVFNGQSRMTVSSSGYSGTANATRNYEQSSFNHPFREQSQPHQYEGESISSNRILPEPHISFLQKFNSMELVEKYNISKENFVGHEDAMLKMPMTPSAVLSSLSWKGAQEMYAKQTVAKGDVKQREQSLITNPLFPAKLEFLCENRENGIQRSGDVGSVNSASSYRKRKSGIGLPARLDTLRLLPTRHRTKHLILTIIAEGGEVVLEFLKPRGRQQEDRVIEVCRISGDGIRFMLYQPDGSRGVPIKNEPPDLPARGVDSIFNYEDIPERHWKKYIYAARFVQMVKAKTPKITLYSDKAKCQLMETMRDFEVIFYDGTKITLSSTDDEMKMVDTSGKVHRGLAAISTASRSMLEHFQETHDHCLTIATMLSTVSHNGKTFPVIIGRRPAGSTVSTPARKEMSSYRFHSLNVVGT
uniref:Serine/threonine-protein kinase PLK4 n=1 Tax=Anopheles dirus TaxID=7168 RepID=A0A182N8Y9_9DIPT